jgi:hypothetical protein
VLIGKGTEQKNAVDFVFKPQKPGEYPCRLFLLSKNDVRVFSTVGLGIATTRELILEFQTAAGHPVKQDIPLQNPSQDTWNYKISFTGDQVFSVPPKLQVKGESIGVIPVLFSPAKVGTFSGTIDVFNLNKECTVIYKLSGVVDEPPAEQKIVLHCQAREELKQTIQFRPFVRMGTVEVRTTVPIISFQSEIAVTSSESANYFEFVVLAQRSGLCAGTLTFTDPVTKNYIWYVLEIHVDPPAPQQVLEIQTVARKSTTVEIPIGNPKDEVAVFSVVLSDDDIFGEKQFTVDPLSSYSYSLVISPLRAMKRTSSVYFYSDDDGEFWYSLHIEAGEPPENALSLITSPIGKYASAFILLENPLDRNAMYRIENDNQVAFQVISKPALQLVAGEKRRIEVRYIPTAVGVHEYATISFHSTDNGDWVFKLSGIGKPPQPLSPVIVSTTVDSACSALLLFSNPFPYPSRFSVHLGNENADAFKFLSKRRVFTLNSFGEEYQICFSFAPKSLGQFHDFVVVASLGPARGSLPELEAMPSVRWVYPVIGNAISGSQHELRHVHCRAWSHVTSELHLDLVGETEEFEAGKYVVSVSVPTEYNFLRGAIETRVREVTRDPTSIVVDFNFSPQRPLMCTATLTVTNPLGQEWQFQIEVRVERGKALETVIIESLLNKDGRVRVCLPVTFRQATAYKAYMASGSATEFRVEPATGFIGMSFEERTELPFEVIFAPKMYGKVLRGVLVVDTIEAQYLFDVVGKTPEYYPPMFDKGTGLAGVKVEEEKKRLLALGSGRRRNIIRQNIENAKVRRHV